ncbi:DMT family transporter [Nocardia stercoris]|uniref:DMT family transporter n=1 Tax=Nocardia stercoris TaxID=2483361 RepID=A0A3M2L0X5_9NOCA|nr:DMT family transporter [Nocardia stercoris]RMI30606.1 hypothetical protein EBN03_21310 [Nocardia stercoris]
MADTHVAAIGCAFAGAVLFAVAAVAQQRAAAAVPEGEGLLRQLTRNPRWWAGMVGDAGGFGLQVAALALGSVLIVQPILVSALVFALPLAARYSGRPVTAIMWAHAAALSIALAIFLVVGDPSDGITHAPWQRWVGPLVVLGALVAAAITVALTVRRPTWQALLLGAAAGLLFGTSAAFTDNVTRLYADVGARALLTNWETYALVATGIGGLYLQQRGYQIGPLSASFPAFTVGEPLAAAAVGATVLDERLRTGPLGIAVVAAAAVVMCVAAVQLSRAEAGPDPVVSGPDSTIAS